MHRRASHVGRRALLAAVLLVAATGPATAHEVGVERFQAPLPLSWLLVGAGATVALTAGWLAVASPSFGRLDPSASVVHLPATVWQPLRWFVRAAFLAVLCWALVAGFGGKRAATNPATAFVWPVWFRGLALASALAGSPWRTLSPWWTVYDLLVAVEGDELGLLDATPAWTGWVATGGFVVLLGVVENLTVVPRSPRLTVAVVAGYGLVMVLGSLAFGAQWLRAADPLGAFFELLGRVAPLAWVPMDDGVTVRLRSPWAGCLPAVSTLALAVLAVAAVYTVSFDGYANTRSYQTVLFGLRDALGTGNATAGLLYVVGLVAFVGLFAGAAAVAERAGRTRSDDDAAGGGWRDATLAFAPTVVPIAAAYEVAHNYPFVVRNLGQLAALLVEPLTGPTSAASPLAWLSVPAFWGTQVLLVVVGHVVAVVAAHGVATRRYATARDAMAGHAPLVVAMVAYTVASLWILSQPVLT